MTTPRAASRTGPGPVERAVRSELRSLKCSVQSDGSAALAVALAAQIDTSRGAVAAAAAAAQLRQLLIDLRRASADARPGNEIDLRAGSRAAAAFRCWVTRSRVCSLPPFDSDVSGRNAVTLAGGGPELTRGSSWY